MKTIRNGVFETNSSSTHALSFRNIKIDYLPKGKKMVIEFIDTNEYFSLITFQEKVSYLVSQIINAHKYSVDSYEALKENVENDTDFLMLHEYILKNYDIDIYLPKTYDGDIEEIVDINHQIACRTLEETLRDLIDDNMQSLLEIVLNKNMVIDIGHD